jgi:hypothetical protein
MKNMKNTFKGKALVEVPAIIPSIGFLEGSFGEEFAGEYAGRVKKDYGNHSNLRVLKYEGGVVTGSNPFAVVLANQILGQEGLRTANQADLEKALKVGALQLRGTYEDTGLVLRSEDGTNSYLAKDIAKQMRARGQDVKFPVMFNLTDLEVAVDQDSNYGLAFRLREGATPIYAPVLNQPGNFNSEDIDEQTGLPKQTGQGNRTLYTRNNGLSRLSLYRVLNLYSNNDNLANSNSVGRVAVVSGKATAENFTDQIEAEYKTQLGQLEARRTDALRVMKGEAQITR